MPRTQTPHRIYLKDYRPPDYLVDQVRLDVALDATATRVVSTLSVRRNPDASAGSPPLVLDGENLDLIDISLDGIKLAPKAYVLSARALTLAAVPSHPFELTIVTECDPSANTALSGLYLSNGTFCTQCEAEGFRRITYFPDRPDVLSVFTVRVSADRTATPVLLSNGNPAGAGELDGGRHYAVWHDPFPKPCYLFALVGGRLGCVADRFITMSGRTVDLHIYVEPGREERCGYAMEALKRAMRWDEERFGREYDLDIFMIVAVSDFNMGAMENKGLNVFNDKYVLASAATATDADYANIEAIIAHEYFHNWTGNRITCRDWFQLCLKEGLTVFRDQEFSSDVRSRAVERIGDVKLLRSHQFPEDAGPLAHPVRPDSFIEINNFYTATVYEKGAELVRMIHTIAGEDGFRAGMNLYFERHDGEAATVEQFVRCFEEAAGLDLKQFRLWYEQAGTPELVATTHHDRATGTFSLDIEQLIPATPGQPKKRPMHIPLRLGLVGTGGGDVPLTLTDGTAVGDGLLHLRKARQTFTFAGVAQRPVLSLLRGFSAPARVQNDIPDSDLLFLMAHDGDLFNRWQAAQSYATRLIIQSYEALRSQTSPGAADAFASAVGQTILDQSLEPAYRAQLLDLPGEMDLALTIGSDVDPDTVHAAREALRAALADRLENDLGALYEAMADHGPYSPDSRSSGRRALRNAALQLLGGRGDAERFVAHYRGANNMTDMMAALTGLTHLDDPLRDATLDDFYDRFSDDALVVDKWFALQALSARPGTVEKVRALTGHERFSFKNPNRMRALIGTFALANPTGFHRADGVGYRLVADTVARLDKTNPQVAARLLGAFKSWRIYDAGRRAEAEAALRGIAETGDLSADVAEIVTSSLAPAG